MRQPGALGLIGAVLGPVRRRERRSKPRSPCERATVKCCPRAPVADREEACLRRAYAGSRSPSAFPKASAVRPAPDIPTPPAWGIRGSLWQRIRPGTANGTSALLCSAEPQAGSLCHRDSAWRGVGREGPGPAGRWAARLRGQSDPLANASALRGGVRGRRRRGIAGGGPLPFYVVGLVASLPLPLL